MQMHRKIIAIIGYIIIAVLGATLTVLGAVNIREQVISNLIMMILGAVLLLIGIRGPILFIQKEKRSEERFQDKNS